MRGEAIGFEWWRRWSDEDKLSILSSAWIDEVTVTQVAHRCDVIRQQIYGWRHELKKKGLWLLDDDTVSCPPMSELRK